MKTSRDEEQEDPVYAAGYLILKKKQINSNIWTMRGIEGVVVEKTTRNDLVGVPDSVLRLELLKYKT